MTLARRITLVVALTSIAPLVLVALGVAVAGGSLAWAATVVLCSAFLVGVVAVVVARRVEHDVAQPLRRLTDAARRNAGGDLGRLSPLAGGAAPEVADLAAALDEVAASVRTALDELHRNRSSFRTALDRVGAALASTHDRGAIVAVLVETASLTVPATVAVFWEWRGGVLRPATAHGLRDPGDVRLTRGTGLAGRALEEGGPVVVSAVDGVLDPGEPLVNSALAVPLSLGSRSYGVLALYGCRRREGFTADDADTVAVLARQAEAAIANTFLHEEARRLAITDGLTGLWNRRQFDLACSQEVDRASRFGEPFSVVMVDLDHFKAINDTHGHQVGDAVLVELAQRLVTATREVDVVARYGGEEFVLLLPRTDLAGAVRLAEKVREAVVSSPFPIDDRQLAVTLSAGVAAYPDHGRAARGLVGAADRALYAAKEGGRNRVVVAPAPDSQPPEPAADEGAER